MPSDASAEGSPTDHLTPIHHGWSLWKTVRLRSAGFPIVEIARLASPAAARAVDTIVTREGELGRAFEESVSLCRAEQDAAGSGDLEAALSRALKRLRKGRLPDGAPAGASVELGRTMADLARAHAALEESKRNAVDVFGEETLRIAGELREVASDPRFREALLWQNRSALENGVDALLRQPGGSRARHVRKHEWLVASYLQRYTTKNETIGFFGPVAWASFDERGDALRVAPGRSLLAKRTVYFELWAVDALAERLAEDIELRKHLPPRRMPTVRLEGRTLHLQDGRSAELPEEFARVLRRCDGITSAEKIASELLEDASLEFAGEEDVFTVLDELVAKRLAIWGFELPVWNWRPERALAEQIDRIAAEEIKARARAALDVLEVAREAVSGARGDVVALDAAFSSIEDAFEQLTSRSASRREGQIYAGRTIVYEDCVRDVECVLGPELKQRLSHPLSLVLASARWYSFEIGERVRALCWSVYRQLCEEQGTGTIEYLRFWPRISDALGSSDAPSDLIRNVSTELQARWARIFGLRPDVHQIDVSSSEIEGRVHTEFAAPRPGWPLARYHSPDVMVAGRSIEAIVRGDYRVVLGEIHVSCNSLFGQIGIAQHPNPDPMFEAARRDVPGLSVTPVESKAHALRADYLPIKPDDPQLEMGTTRAALPRDCVIEAAELLVEEDEGRLVVRTRSGGHRFDPVAFLEQYLTFAAHSCFKMLPSLPHSPRITIDDVVLERERWTFDPQPLTFAWIEDPYERFAQARRWATSCGLRRWMFLRVPEEKKPFFVDFESPIMVDLLSRQVRKASVVGLSEMLPSPEEVWLIDAGGERYTSEFRMAAVDPVPFTSP